MTLVAVIAHKHKTFGAGLEELRRILAAKGVTDPLWFEVSKSRQAPDRARQAVAQGADLLFIWGGDGTVQRCADAVAGESVDLAILPAGTANLLATNLKIPMNLPAAVDVGLSGDRRRLDLGVLNDERFAVMAGIGFDAIMMRDADRTLKSQLGRLAYVWTGVLATQMKGRKVRVDIDGEPGSKVMPRAYCSVRWERWPRGSWRFPTRVPMTDCSRWASSRRRTSRNGLVCSVDCSCVERSILRS